MIKDSERVRGRGEEVGVWGGEEKYSLKCIYRYRGSQKSG